MYKPVIIASATLLVACFGGSDADTQKTAAVEVTESPATATAMADTPMAEALAEKVITETKTKAVLIYADWCGSCKVLDPKIQAVQAMGSMPGVEFVTLDYTERDADDFYAQARAAGVEQAVRTELDDTIKTGWLLLVDVDDRRVLSKVTRADDTAQIVAKIEEALDAS
ncbi:MAG: thioredoxin family protein [Pseudomonadota bacterium]